VTGCAIGCNSSIGLLASTWDCTLLDRVVVCDFLCWISTWFGKISDSFCYCLHRSFSDCLAACVNRRTGLFVLLQQADVTYTKMSLCFAPRCTIIFPTGTKHSLKAIIHLVNKTVLNISSRGSIITFWRSAVMNTCCSISYLTLLATSSLYLCRAAWAWLICCFHWTKMSQLSHGDTCLCAVLWRFISSHFSHCSLPNFENDMFISFTVFL